MRIEKNRTAILLFILLAIAYALTCKGHIEVTDTIFSYKTARAIVEDRALDIKCGIERIAYCFTTPDGKSYSQYGLGLPFIFVPYVLAGKLLAMFTHLPEDTIIPFLISFYNIFFGAGSCVVAFLYARRLGFSERTSLAASLVLGFCTMCWCYSGWDFSEPAQMFFLFTAVYFLGSPGRASLLAASASFACLIFVKAVSVIYLPFLLWYAASSGDRAGAYRRCGYFLSFILAAVAALFYFNYIRFGNIFETGYGSEANRFFVTGLSNIKYLLFSLNKGIFIFNPILIFSVFGFLPFFRSNRREAILFLALIIANLCITAMWYGWGGGWCWGPRLLLPALGFWFLPIVFLVDKRGAARIAIAAVVAISFLVQLPGVLQSPFEYLDIKYNRVAKELQEKMPLTMAGSFIILKHKILERNRTYRLSEFGINSDAIIRLPD